MLELLNLKTLLKLTLAILLCVAGWLALPDVEENLPTGVDASKLSPEPRYSIDGKETTREAVDAVLLANYVPDDSGKIRLVLIGDEAARRKVLDDFTKPRLKALSDKLVINAYPDDHPLVKQAGFVTSGDVDIYVMRADGKVLGRNHDGKYHGPEWLACAIEQKPYDPSKDPDLTPKPGPRPNPDGPSPLLPSLPDLQQVPWFYWVVGAILIYLVFLRKGAK